MKLTYLLTIAATLSGTFASCSSVSRNCRTAETADTITYRIAHRYYVKNNVDSVPTVITSDKEFKHYFGSAPVMGAGGLPTEINFRDSFVISAVSPETNVSTTLSPVSLYRNENGVITLNCLKNQGVVLSYTIRPLLLLVVNKKNYAPVVVKYLSSPAIIIIHCGTAEAKELVLKKASQLNAATVYDYTAINAVAIQLPPGLETEDGIEIFKSIPGVVAVEQDRQMQMMD